MNKEVIIVYDKNHSNLNKLLFDKDNNYIFVDCSSLSNIEFKDYYYFIGYYGSSYQSSFDRYSVDSTRYLTTDAFKDASAKIIRENLAIHPQILNDIKKGNCRLIIDTSNEGYFEYGWENIHRIFEVDPSNIVWVTGDANIKNHRLSTYDFKVVNFWEKVITDNVINDFKLRMICEVYQNPKNSTFEKTHYCTFYNRRPRENRYEMMIEMEHHKLLDNMIWSWGGDVDRDMFDFGDGYKSSLYSMFGSKYQTAIDSVMSWGNIQNYEASSENLWENLAIIYNFQHIFDTYYQFVCETFADDKCLFLTEKAYKPFMFQQPFVFWGNPHAVAYLKSRGYKVFDRWIDHSYDSIDNHILRRKTIVDEIKRLNSIPKSTWDNMLLEMSDDLSYNFHHLVNTAFTRDGLVL